MKVLFFCKKYMFKHKITLIVYLAITITVSCISIISPFVIGNFLDALIEGGDIGVIVRFCVIFGGLSIAKLLIGYITSVMYIKVQSDISYSLNMDTIKHLQNLSLSYTNNKDSANLNQRVNIDAVEVITFSINLLSQFITNLVLLFIPFFILLTMNIVVTFLLVGFLLIYAALYFIFKKPLYNANFALKESYNNFFASLYEQLKYIKQIKINSIGAQINQRADKNFEEFRNKSIGKQKINYIFSGLAGFTSTIAQIVLFVVGGVQILRGNFTIGMFTVFSSYFNMIITSSKYFFSLGAVYQQCLVSLNRLEEIFLQIPEINGKTILQDINEISFSNLSFTYGSHIIIKNLNEKFKKGKIYAIVGENGTGKSTLINLLMGLHINEYEGNITYNKIDIRDIDMVETRKKMIAFTEQEPMMIKGTVNFNLTFTNEGTSIVNNAQFEEYINILNLGSFFSKKHLDFEMNEAGSNTSGGEKQKISILRALLKNADVLILDEPTSALDDITSHKFINYLKNIKNNKIIIIITHDEFIKSQCDAVKNLHNSLEPV
ncbi:MAG: ABC transporter ATP-binding protein/permease [Defluviitaleaceae bacterium]|nr:ABC transporter ATP-binding protein/permease [Defluviitaleaceae bacterium]